MSNETKVQNPVTVSGKTAAHTPGPWTAVKARIEIAGKRGFRGNYRVADAYFSAELADTPRHEEACANARLIAAAPELVAALERTLSYLTSYRGGAMGCYEQARAALAKAKGAA
jgi:hypothetical protein